MCTVVVRRSNSGEVGSTATSIVTSATSKGRSFTCSQSIRRSLGADEAGGDSSGHDEEDREAESDDEEDAVTAVDVPAQQRAHEDSGRDADEPGADERAGARPLVEVERSGCEKPTADDR